MIDFGKVKGRVKNWLKDTRLFEHIYALNWQRVSNSWLGEDLVIRSFYDRLAKDRKITVTSGCSVDVGAFRPIALSNTYYYYRRGWHCINIDPTPGSKRLFDRIRPRDTNLELAISEKDGRGSFYVFGQPSAWNTMDAEAAALAEKSTGIKPRTADVELCRLETVLDRHINGRSFELLTIDAEGYDIQILRSNNFTRYAPRIILIEVHLESFASIESSDVFVFLKSAGYTLYSWINPTLMFVRNDSLLVPD